MITWTILNGQDADVIKCKFSCFTCPLCEELTGDRGIPFTKRQWCELRCVFDVDPYKLLTHWGRVTHICVSERTIISSDNGLSPGRRQAIIWTNAGILLIGPLGTNFIDFFLSKFI